MVERNRNRRWGLGCIVGLLVAAGLAWTPSFVEATTSLAEDLEVQAWYRMRNTFQTDGNEHFDWVQWRNEAFIWLTYDNMVDNGKLKALGDLSIPFVENAGISARYRVRVDPVYYLREHYRNIYDEHHQSKLFEPENGFRDLYIDMKHGEIGPGRLSTRFGYQQIVWGESDLFRSLDIINPLRIDQNFPIGEKFDEFRLPILSLKFLYELGNMGQALSDTAIEGYWSPRWRGLETNLLDEGIFRIQFQERGCLPPGGTQVLDYTPENCGKAGTKFLPYRPFWVGNRRIRNPWSLSRAGNNSDIDSGDYFCINQSCRADVPGERGSLIVNLPKGKFHHHTRGTDPDRSTGGIRFLAKTEWGVDFSLNYLFQPNIFADTNPNHPTLTFGDFPGAAGSFQDGLLRCLSPSGKQGVGRNGQTNSNGNPPGGTVVLVGSDLGGYDWPERRIDAQGNPLKSAKQKQAARAPVTVCTNGFNHKHIWTHVIGLTATYNDFDYTGAVFRLEQSLSTKEGLNKRAIGYGKTFFGGGTAVPPDIAANYADRNGKILVFTPVWRSMVGFDLVSALANYRPFAWTKQLPGQIGTQQSFFTFQWLMQYNFDNITNNMCNWNFAMGIGPQGTGCITNRWNHFFTFAWVNNGFFRGKMEQRTAVALEPRGQAWLLYGQWWWRGFMDTPVDLSFGTSWFPSSRHDNSWTLINYFVNRNLLWFEGTYYLL